MNHDRSFGRLLAGKESAEAAERPGHRDVTEVQRGIGSKLKCENSRRCRQAPESAAVSDFALIAITMHVVHPSNLQVRPPVLVDVEDELEDVLGCCPDHCSTLATDDERLAHA